MNKVDRTLKAMKDWKQLSAPTKIMAIVLAQYADEGNYSPTINELARDVHTGHVPVFRALKHLRNAGLISWEHIAIEGRGACNNVYTLNFLEN